MLIKIPQFDFVGIRKIEIPKIDEDFNANNNFGKDIIRKFLSDIIKTHKKNQDKIDYCYNYTFGKQDIYNKERLYLKDAINNNKIQENHAYRQVNFKTSFLVGEKRKYTYKTDTESDDLLFLERYLTDCNFYSKDDELKNWIYSTGVGATYCSPRTDIIINEGIDTLTGKSKSRYKDKNEGYDKEKEAPFNFYTIDPRNNFVVYSSGFSKEPLFCVSIIDIDVSSNNIIKIAKEIIIETRYTTFRVQGNKVLNIFDYENMTQGAIKALNYLPIIEYSVNQERIGLVELNRSLFNAVNTLKSSTTDMIVDKANVLLVFKNTDIQAEQIQEMKANGAIIIGDGVNSSASNVKADLDTIKIEIPFEGLNSYYEQLITPAYDIAGVPLATSQVSSAGDTGQAKLVGGGWNNAYTIIKGDITYLLRYDYELLKLMLKFCRLVPESPVNELYASQIDISYSINQNDNFLVKAQGIMNLYNVNMPKKFIIEASGLFSDIQTVSKEWELYDKNKKEEENKEKQQDNKITTTKNIVNENNTLTSDI